MKKEVNEEETAIVPAGAGALDPFGSEVIDTQNPLVPDRPRAFFSTMPTNTRAEKIAAYNALSAEGKPLADCLNQTIPVVHVLAHTITLQDGAVDAVTGEMTDADATRIVLVDVEGKTYHAVSKGVLSSIQRAGLMVGPPPWEPPLMITPRKAPTRTQGFSTIVLDISE